MSQALYIPDDVYQTIREYAAQSGQTPEEAVLAWAQSLPEPAAVTPSASHERVNDPAFDPWAGFRGVATALSPDSLDRHDIYLAEEYANRHEHEE